MIEIQGLTKQYGSVQALTDLNLSIENGDIFGFIGPNGAGKSTTFKILATLLVPDRGMAVVDGYSVLEQARNVRKLIGYMPDVFGTYEDMTVQEYLTFFAALYDVGASKRSSVVDGVLELTDLTGKKRADCASLSRGMQQRLGLARVLLHDPKILLLDEPASGLDPRARIEIRELLKELRSLGKTILISSHILRELSEIATRFGIIERGNLLFSGTPEELLRKVQHKIIMDVSLEERASQAADVLSELDFVATAQNLSSTELEVEIRDLGFNSLLVKTLVEKGFAVKRVTRRELDLEASFMLLTKGQVA